MGLSHEYFITVSSTTPGDWLHSYDTFYQHSMIGVMSKQFWDIIIVNILTMIFRLRVYSNIKTILFCHEYPQTSEGKNTVWLNS